MKRIIVVGILFILFAVHSHAQTDEQLKNLYTLYNQAYFGSKLPSNTVVHWTVMTDCYLAETTHVNGLWYININSNYKDELAEPGHWARTMTHEMTHILCLYDNGFDNHGSCFAKKTQELKAGGVPVDERYLTPIKDAADFISRGVPFNCYDVLKQKDRLLMKED